ncbi:Tetratricopeptide repeat protein 39C [Choanephora cucurbitarum]|uniref:Tetratricopeptide repeat protein 39C n=1 Tax=Choanephora cucurbitarum TaxID=101091 RepID=A0A1C7NQB4_9FUNG|nr:Tetratricopeptide repeat protein 39C [Choanephora cucurbitarum]
MVKNKGSLSKKSPWKAIQKKIKPERPASIHSQESHQTISSAEINDEKPKPQEMIHSSRSSTASNDLFEDALSLKEDPSKNEKSHHSRQDIESKTVESEENISVEEASKRSEPTRMSLILPALQSYETSDDDSGEEEEEKNTFVVKQVDGQEETKEKDSSSPLKQTELSSIAEVEALGIASPPSPSRLSKPITYEPIPTERTQVLTNEIEETDQNHTVQSNHVTQDEPEEQANIPSSPLPTADLSKNELKITEADQKQPVLTERQNVADEQIDLKTVLAESVLNEENTAPAVDEKQASQEPKSDANASAVIETKNDTIEKGAEKDELGSSETIEDKSDDTEHKEERDESIVAQHLAAILPAVEESVKAISEEQSKLPKPSKRNSQRSEEEEQQRASRSREYERSIEDPIDLDLFKDNTIVIQAIDPKDIPANNLKPHEQEAVDEPIRKAMDLLFDNKFMKAKSVFQTKASIDPLHALGLGSMAFIKAIMTYYDSDFEIAMEALTTAYTIAKTQIDNTSFKKPFKSTVSQYFSTLVSTNTGLPSNPPSFSMPNSSGGLSDPSAFLPNGVLRAHVIKAECCLLMGILQMTQESVVGYIKCGLNIRRAYHSYSIVWQEYKKMGQEYTKYMDPNTVSAIQFGIGSVHLILSSMPPKVLKTVSVLGWKSDKQLGFALLKLCLEGQGIRAPLASLTLLAYYSILTSFAPQLYTKEIMTPAIECLLNAQKSHPNSCFFLFFAARIARVARNIPLSTQSFTFSAESSRGEWAEVAMKQMSDYEIGFNSILQLKWEQALVYFEKLSGEKYWSVTFSKYLEGACYEMMGFRTEAILAFAQIPELAKSQQNQKATYIDAYVLKKVKFFQQKGYQDMDFSLPGLEVMLVMNAFEHIEPEALEKCLVQVEHTLGLIYEREKIEYNIRLKELVPSTAPPDYYDQRAVLLLTKASILNSLGRYDQTISHLNWILDHRDQLKNETWVVPFTYWESGVTSWGLNNYHKSRKLWQLAMACSKYDFEYRMAVRLSLALSKCDEMGIPPVDEKELKGSSTNSRKRMPLIS